MHEHSKCEHELKYCMVCDVVYCEKCKSEWKKMVIWNSSPVITYEAGTTLLHS